MQIGMGVGMGPGRRVVDTMLPSYPFAPSDMAGAILWLPTHSTGFTNGTARGLYVGGAGNVTLLTAAGTTVLFSSVPAGTVLPVSCKRVNSTGTTATLMTAIF